MGEPVMKLKNLKKSISNKPIIKGLDFEIYSGEVFGFLGPNGAGKTTTIRMMVGLMSMTDGDVIIKGQSVKKDFKKAIRYVGGIVENPEMYPFMTGWKNLIHYSRMVPGISKERIQEVVRLVGLEKRMKDKVSKYSLGMRQRLGIAQALLHNPSILILDEPTNGLDPSGIREIRSYIRRLAAEEGVAVIVSSHILSEMEMMCDRIGIIKNGELISIQSVHDALQQSDQKEVTIEARPMNDAYEILQGIVEGSVNQHQNELMMSVKKEEIPLVIAKLVEQNIDIFSVNVNRSTLEDKFLDLIGEGTIE
ncbi:ABC transporter ATP-binding protein [Halobacillus shinanisalinarum]|uniref:ABC transporter ATP-binding protein n=1 Tax=Halobacillus shinanisalinarum TaxID=2932258 RepID=A0ABY4GU21_9BACI|nr:ABC transporter ATP-binding protein [Halobacillus shinanisalinarum]UOQ91658.1 ABC transporter ATP-binding protein [Halobacillus shinanisalinarum]